MDISIKYFGSQKLLSEKMDDSGSKWIVKKDNEKSIKDYVMVHGPKYFWFSDKSGWGF